MRRNRSPAWLCVAGLLLALAGCRCIAPAEVTAYGCAQDGSCPTGQQCCPDNLCRADCTVPAVCEPACDPGFSCVAGGCLPTDCQDTDCAPNQVCVDGRCREKTCVGVVCPPDTTVCVAGHCQSLTCGPVTCDAGFACADAGVCFDSACDGVTCQSAQRCEAGRCVDGCLSGKACDTNPGAPCKLGTTACAAGQSSCVDGEDNLDGVSCGATQVCAAGACVECRTGNSCATNPTPCVNGTLDCASAGGARCNDGTGLRPPGKNCGPARVCDGDGGCFDCAAGTTCTGNSIACKVGVVACGSGTPVCQNGGNRPAGSACGNGQVCDGNGACITCVEGAACGTNPDPCKVGALQCLGGAPACADGNSKSAGASCGTDLVCNQSGACVACVANQMCTGNPSPCKVGLSSCATGAQTCVDTAANRPTGGSCGTNQVCNQGGSCVACTAGGACSGNPNVCKVGVGSCTTGSLSCVDGTGNAAAGTNCGMGQVCNGAGGCGACTMGTACTGNPTPCKQGVTDCSTGTARCLDGTGKSSPGTTCGANQVCNASGSCVSCLAGQSCATNSGAPCKLGATSCATGASTCVDASNTPPGASCGMVSYGSYGACGGFSGTCGVSGTQSRSVATPTCNGSGGCANVVTTQTTGCTRADPPGSCSPDTYGAFGGCNTGSSCAGTQTRPTTSYHCSGGGCVGYANGTDSRACNAPDGQSCGTTVYGMCSFANACVTTGSRTVTSYSCLNGGCPATNGVDSAGCTQVATGCFNASSICVAGTARANCGSNGDPCDNCGVDGLLCVNHVCQ